MLLLEQQPSKRRIQTYSESVSRTARHSYRKEGVKMLEQNIYKRPMGQFTQLFLKQQGGLYLHVNYLLAVYLSQKRQNTGL